MTDEKSDNDKDTKKDSKTDTDTHHQHHKTLVETIKEHLPNPTEMIIHQTIEMFIQWYNRRILIFSSLIMIGIPISMIFLGIYFFHSCPKSFYLRLHMIICGIISLISALLLLSLIIIWKKNIKLTSKIIGYQNRILLFIEIFLFLICFIGLILLTIVLINISSTVHLSHPITSNYCHPILYYSSYTLLFLFYILLTMIMIIFFRIFYAYQKTQE